ncbi:MAG: tetratricopeptide repeat protein [Alphaproteobacteria bacterium]|nr:tetratricopeptide repeat protein [Alphaproteobacteria bacterium]
MSEHNVDIQSLLETVDAYLRTRVALYLDFHALVDVENAGQREARAILADLGFAGLLEARAAAGPAEAPAPSAPVGREPVEVEDFSSLGMTADEEADFHSQASTERWEPREDEEDEPEEVDVLDIVDLDELDPVSPDPEPAPAFAQPPSDTIDLDLDLDLPEEPTQVDFSEGSEKPGDADIEEIDLDLDDFVEIEDDDGPAFPGTFDSSDDETVAARPSPLQPLPELDDEDVSDPVTLGDPDETEDLLRESAPVMEPTSQPTFFDDEDDLSSEPVEIAEIEVEEPGQDALVTIEDTSDPRSDLEGLSRLADSDLDDDDPDTGNDEVVVRTRQPDSDDDSFDLMPDSDFSPDDEETFVADLADIEKMKAKMATAEDSADDPSESEVMLPPPETTATPRGVAPRAVAVAGVAGVAAGVAGVAAGPAGVRAGPGGPQVTAGLYGNPSVPQIRDRNAPKPRAAAIQIDAALEEAAKGGSSGALLEEDELLELGSSEDYGEEYDEDAGGGGLSLDVQEYEEDLPEEEEEEDDDIELEEVEPEPVFDDTVDPGEVKRVTSQAEKAVEDGDMEAAIDLYSDILDLDPENVDAHVRRGRLYLDYGDYSRAMSDFMIADELAPDNPEPQIAVGDLYFARKDYSRAIQCFNDALKMDPNNAMAYCRRGISHYYRKRFTEALADLTQAQKLDDDIPNIRTYIAMAKKKAKK